MSFASKLVTIVQFRNIAESLHKDQWISLLSSICTECGMQFLREIICNGLQYTNDPQMEHKLQIIMQLTSTLSSQSSVSASAASVSSPLQKQSTLQLNDLTEISISNICSYLALDDLLNFECTNRYIFITAHNAISCVSLLNKADWFNLFLTHYYESYKKTNQLNLTRFHHVESLSFILNDSHKGSIMHTAKEIARMHHWSYSIPEFQSYCNYIACALKKLSKLKPIYFKCTLHFDWGIKNILSQFPFRNIWTQSIQHIHFYNMKWNQILRFLELQFHHVSNKDNKVIPLTAVTFENILWERSYLNEPRKYFDYFLELLFNFCFAFKTHINQINVSNEDRNEVIAQNNYAKLYGLNDDALNGKLVKIVYFSVPHQKWKCKLVCPRIGYNGAIHSHMLMETSHLKPVLFLNNSNPTSHIALASIHKLQFIHMSLHDMRNDADMRHIRAQMLQVFDDLLLLDEYITKSLRYLVFHSNGNDALFCRLVSSLVIIRSSSFISLHLQTIKHLQVNDIMFDVLPFQSFDNLRELCIESTENTSYLLLRVAISIIAFERIHLCIRSGLYGNNAQSKAHKEAVSSLLNAVFSEFNQNSLQLLSFDMVFEFDAMDFQSAYFSSVEAKLSTLQSFYEILIGSITSTHVQNMESNRCLKLKINLKYNIEIENNYLTRSKRKQLIDIITKRLNYFPMLFYEVCKGLLSIRRNVMILFKCSFSDKSLYVNSNLSLMLNDIKKNKLFQKVKYWEHNIDSISEIFEFGIIAKTDECDCPYRTKWLCSCAHCDDDEFFQYSK